MSMPLGKTQNKAPQVLVGKPDGSGAKKQP